MGEMALMSMVDQDCTLDRSGRRTVRLRKVVCLDKDGLRVSVLASLGEVKSVLLNRNWMCGGR